MIELSVCIGSSCHIKGSYNVIQIFQQMIEENSLHDRIGLKTNFCMRRCNCNGIAVSVNGQAFDLTPETAREFLTTEVIPMLGSL